MKEKLQNLFNHYLLYFTIFLLWLCWILFLDQNNLITQYEYFNELKKVNNEINYYQKELIKVKSDLQQLLTHPEELEKFAREKYFMKKDEEDIFVIYNTDKKTILNNNDF